MTKKLISMLFVLIFTLPAWSQANELANSSFETTETTNSGRPSTFGVWSGDDSEIVSAEAGIIPRNGVKMLRFKNTNAGGPGLSNASEVYQLIDVTSLRTQIDAGQVTLNANAYFNRIASSTKNR